MLKMSSFTFPFTVFGSLTLLILIIDVALGFGGFSSTAWHLRSFLNTLWFSESVAAIGTAIFVLSYRKNIPYSLPWILTGISVSFFYLWTLYQGAFNGSLWASETTSTYWEGMYQLLHVVIGYGTPFRDFFGFTPILIFIVTQLFVVAPLAAGYLYRNKNPKP